MSVLDQAGNPLISIANLDPYVWRTPLVSGEISEFLPYWETSVILSDTSAFEERVRATRYALLALVLSLALSVSGGAIVLWRLSSARLREAQRRTGFVTTVSHELKTPLTSIRMYSEMLAEGADLDRGKRDRYIACIVSESERLTRLINDVLDVAKLERKARPFRLDPVDITAVVRETLDGLSDRLMTSGFSISISTPDYPVVSLSDKESLIRILVNLISNAEKYSRDNREIDISVSYNQESHKNVVSVSDRGIGIPRSHRQKIFREFHRVDESLTSQQGGTGLGLSIARSLARSMGGDVLYYPRDRVDGGAGSVFSLSLPVYQEEERV